MATRSEFMNGLVKDNDLIPSEDLFELKRGNKSIWIIKRQGIEKIQYNNNIHIKFEWVRMEKDYAVLKGIGTKGDLIVESYGESTSENTKQNPPYHSAMAEKRALSRVVLKIVGAYKFGVFGEDEADDFKEKN
tara:strand:+ start:194 stop:592 length:399 start_codon:yes stop_codon:yes gene_type:complete